MHGAACVHVMISLFLINQTSLDYAAVQALSPVRTIDHISVRSQLVSDALLAPLTYANSY